MREPINPLDGAPSSASVDDAGGASVFRKISWRLLPLLFVCYIIAYIDRINVGFAKLHLREALGVDETVFATVFGLGAGLFFIGYFLFEVPSNLISATGRRPNLDCSHYDRLGAGLDVVHVSQG